MTQNILRAWRRLFSLLIVIFPLLAILILAWSLLLKAVETAKAEAATDATVQAEHPAPATAAATGHELAMSIGDRLNVTFFERLNFDEEAKWAALSKSRRPPNNFYQRTEMSGTFQVEESGAVVIPLLGPITVAGKSVADFEKAAAQAFEQRVGRFGFVSVQVQRQPVYVLGPVKKPGPYEFSPGMTVLHFLSLAGGLDRVTMDAARMMQVVTEGEKRQKSAQSAARLLARLAVLTAESEGRAPETPPRLADLTGKDEADKLVRSEQTLRQLKAEARRTELASLEALETAAQSTLEQKRSLVTQIAASIRPQQERAGNMLTLARKGTVNNTVRLEAEAALSNARERHQQAMIEVAEAETKVKQIGADRAKIENESKIALAQEIASVRVDISDVESTMVGSAAMLDAMRSGGLTGSESNEDSISFEVVRATPEGHSTISVPGTFALKPGDLIQVRTRADGSSRKTDTQAGPEVR